MVEFFDLIIRNHMHETDAPKATSYKARLGQIFDWRYIIEGSEILKSLSFGTHIGGKCD